MKRVALYIWLFIAWLFLAGCATYNDESRAMRTLYAAGEFSEAKSAAEAMNRSAQGGPDELLTQLELGKCSFASADAQSAVKAFESVYENAEFFDANGTGAVDWTQAVLVNPSRLPYTGYNYDRIMAASYMGLCYIELGRKERAAVAFRRLLNYQQEAAAAYAKRIDETADALAKNRGNAGAVNALASAPSVSAELARHYGNFDSYIAAKAKFTNPFAHYLTGIFLMHNFQSLSDKENAIVSLRLADAGTGALSEEIAAAQDSAHGKNAEFRTYLIYECGMACRRDQFKVDLPLWVFNRNLPGISASFPYLYKISCSAKLEVSLDGRRIALNKIADMDDIITEEFNANLPTLIYRTLLSVVVKASAQYAGARAAGDYGVFVNLAGSLYQGIVNNADLRTWTTLPKTISVASFKTPSSMVVKINSATVKLKGKNNIIYITLPATGAPATVRTFPL